MKLLNGSRNLFEVRTRLISQQFVSEIENVASEYASTICADSKNYNHLIDLV